MHALDRGFNTIAAKYQAGLAWVLRVPMVAVALTVAFATAAYVLLQTLPREYAPVEDQGAFFVRIQAPEGAGFEHLAAQAARVEKSMQPYVESGDIQRGLIVVPGFGNAAGIVSVTLRPWNERSFSTEEIKTKLERAWSDIPDLRMISFMRSGLSRGGGGQPVQVVLGGPNYEELARWRDTILERAAENPGLLRLDSDLKETQPQVLVRIDKNRAASLGVSVRDIGQTLQTLMSERQVTTYVVDGEEYDVVLQARADQRGTYADLTNIYVRSQRTGQLVLLANLTTLEDSAGPGILNHYNRLRAVTITANLAPGYSLGDALDYLESLVRTELPASAQVDYKGESLEYKEASNSLLFTFGIALLVVFLVLAAQFESFVHPVVIMITVPLAITGGFLGLALAGKTLNIYSQIGIVMLIGIAAKNGVLIVEFINQLRDEGKEFTAAILEAARIRFRPVVMTTCSTLMGSVPLILASGPGAESRATLGIVTFSGISIATVFTLFVVPAFYKLLAAGTGSPNAVSHEIERLKAQPVS